MVPGHAIEEFNTLPTSLSMTTRTRRKIVAPTTDLVDIRDSSNDLHDNIIIQLGNLEELMVTYYYKYLNYHYLKVKIMAIIGVTSTQYNN